MILIYYNKRLSRQKRLLQQRMFKEHLLEVLGIYIIDNYSMFLHVFAICSRSFLHFDHFSWPKKGVLRQSHPIGTWQGSSPRSQSTPIVTPNVGTLVPYVWPYLGVIFPEF